MRRGIHGIVVLVRGDAEVASWALARADPERRPLDLSVVDDLARLQLAARRLGCSVRVGAACWELGELLDLVGLGDLLADSALRQVGGEAEGGEEAGVEEVVVADDPVA